MTSPWSTTTRGNGDQGLAVLLAGGQLRKIICSFPRQSDSYVFDVLSRASRHSV
jgi:3-oxoadipate CoA-transferase, alpha subunit